MPYIDCTYLTIGITLSLFILTDHWCDDHSSKRKQTNKKTPS